MTVRKPSGVWAPEDDLPVPEPPFLKKILLDIWEGLFALVVGGLALWVEVALMLMAAYVSPLLGMVAAVLLVAPTMAGLMVPCARSARGSFLRLSDAVPGILRLYGRSVMLALPLVILIGIVAMTVQIVNAYPGRQELVFSLAIQVGVTLTLILAHIYLYPVLALYDTSLKQTVLLAGALAAKFVWQTLVLTLVAGVLFVLASLHPLALVLVVGPWCVIAVNAAWRLAQRILPPAPGIDK